MDEQTKKILAEPVNPDYQKGMKEIADLLTFLPEEMRMFMVMNFTKNICKM